VKESLQTAIAKGKNLQVLKLAIRARFSVRDVMEVMLRTPDSQIRTVSVGGFLYTVGMVPSIHVLSSHLRSRANGSGWTTSLQRKSCSALIVNS
jgi:hypothetical protein